MPIISDEALFDQVLGGHGSFVEQYANYIAYPLDDRDNLPRMAKYRKLDQQAVERQADRDFTDTTCAPITSTS